MIPSEDQIVAMWETYHLPQNKRTHMSFVAKVAVYLATECCKVRPDITIDIDLLRAAALLHDIDKAIPRLVGEQHPDTAVRVVKEHGFDSVAQLIKTHSLYSIVDPQNTPITWEEKLLYLADKMVKHSIITVDERFELWKREQLPKEALKKLHMCYPQVKALEKEIFTMIGVAPEHVKNIGLGQT